MNEIQNPPSTRKQKSKLKVTSIVGLATVATTAFIFKNAEPDVLAIESESVRPARVWVEKLDIKSIFRTSVVPGVVSASSQTRLGFPVGGRLIERNVNVGDRVKSGQVIGRVDGRGFSNAVNIAKASLQERSEQRAQLARDAERSRKLGEQGALTDSSLERVESGLNRATAAEQVAAASLQESKRQRGDSVLRAPFDGVVTTVYADVGQVVDAGFPVVRLVGADRFEAVVEVNSQTANAVSEGDSVDVKLGSSSSVNATIRTVVRDATSESGLHPIVIDLPTTVETYSGADVSVTLKTHPLKTAVVPLSAILDPSGESPFVWTLENQRVVRQSIVLGELRNGGVVVEGLPDGIFVVTRGHGRLIDQDVIEVVK